MSEKLYRWRDRKKSGVSEEVLERRKKRNRAYAAKFRREREQIIDYHTDSDKSESRDDAENYKPINNGIDYGIEFKRFNAVKTSEEIKQDQKKRIASYYTEKLRQYKSPVMHYSDKLRHKKAETKETREEIKQTQKLHEQSKRKITENVIKRTGAAASVLSASNEIMIRATRDRDDKDTSEDISDDAGKFARKLTNKSSHRRGKYGSKLHKRRTEGGKKSLKDAQRKHMKKRMQKKSRKEAEKNARRLVELVKKLVEVTIESVKGIVMAVESHPLAAIIILIILLIFLAVTGVFSSCSMVGGLGENYMVGTSYTAEDEDIIGADEDYTALEDDLRDRIENIPSEFPGYDEYKYELDDVGHDPYKLAAILTVIFEAYKRDEVQGKLKKIFELQYDFSTKAKTEKRKKWVERDGKKVEVEYDYKILTVKLVNHGLDYVAEHIGLTENQLERYHVLVMTCGNRKYLFDGSRDRIPGDDDDDDDGRGDYEIPPDYLTDEQFARMMVEAKKYLGMPYVWGGSSPEEGFDCSGYVSWVINHCGNGWNVGRQSANGLKNCTARVKESDVKPGDLVFFKGTYHTKGASHVGIVVDPVRKVMIHCGNPISFASYNTDYWNRHKYCYGRIH